MDNQGVSRNSETEIDLLELMMVLLSHLAVIIIVTVCCGAIGFIGTKAFIPQKYTAKTYLYVRNSDDLSEKISTADLSVSRSLVSTYIAILQNRAVVKEVAAALPNRLNEEQMSKAFTLVNGEIPVSRLQSCISMASDGNTEILVISAKTTDPLVSAAICDTYNVIAPDYLIRMVGAGSVEAISSAEIPTSPSEPNPLKNGVIAALAGFILVCGIYVVIFLLDHSVETEDDLKAFNVPFLGDVPEIYGAQGKKKKNRRSGLMDEESTLLSGKMPFAVSESYKAIRSSIMFSLAVSDKKIIAVTSSNASEGKSVTAANIAITLAMTEAKVLLIDADMRKPVQHRRFSLTNEHGLSEVLGRMKTFEGVVHRNVTKRLDVLTSGAIPPNPSELMTSSVMKALLAGLEQRYDYIVIDTPPVNVVTDAVGLAPYIGGYVIVAKYHTTKTDEISYALSAIKQSDANILGIIITQVERAPGAYGKYGKYCKYGKNGKYGSYGYGYGYGYGYEKSEPVIGDVLGEKPAEN